jgi:hypothetical protein
MTTYAITAVDIDADGHIVRVEGAELDAAGMPSEPPAEVPVEHIVFALERGDEVRARFASDAEAGAGPRFRIRSGSLREIELESELPGRAVKDLPRISGPR